MTKAEILEAINSVIVSNDQKGITAEVLANILVEIVNAAPEGHAVNIGTIGDGSDLTLEQKINNAKVYEAAMSKTLSAPIVILHEEAAYITSNIVFAQDDKVEILFSMPDYMSEVTNPQGYLKAMYQVELYADGSVNLIEMSL